MLFGFLAISEINCPKSGLFCSYCQLVSDLPSTLTRPILSPTALLRRGSENSWVSIWQLAEVNPATRI